MSLGDSSPILGGIPDTLRLPLIIEYNKLIKNHRESRWEPAELNGGKLCEIVYTIIKGYIDGSFPQTPYKPANMIDDCRRLEQATSFPRAIRIQIPRMLVSLYEVRNNRNVGHVGADVDPNHMDASVVLAMCRWIMAELVRVFHQVTTEEATIAVDALVERDAPLLWKIGNRTRVLNTKLSAKDKMLAILYGSLEPVSLPQMVRNIDYSNATQFRAKVVLPAHRNGLIDFDEASKLLRISPLGSKHVETNIPLAV